MRQVRSSPSLLFASGLPHSLREALLHVAAHFGCRGLGVAALLRIRIFAFGEELGALRLHFSQFLGILDQVVHRRSVAPCKHHQCGTAGHKSLHFRHVNLLWVQCHRSAQPSLLVAVFAVTFRLPVKRLASVRTPSLPLRSGPIPSHRTSVQRP